MGRAGPSCAISLELMPRSPILSPPVLFAIAFITLLRLPPRLPASPGSILILATLSYIGPRLPARSIFFSSCPGEPRSPILAKSIVLPKLPRSAPKSGSAFVMPLSPPVLILSIPGNVPPAKLPAAFVAADII